MEIPDVNPLFSRFDHIGVVVRNIDKAIKHYQSLGIGPFVPVTTAVAEKKVYGKDTEKYGVELRMARMGQIGIELIQPISGYSTAQEFLDKKGEGINHICFAVDDIEKEAARMLDKGFRIISRIKFRDGGGNAYFDTGAVGGVLIELLQQPPE